MTKQLYTVKDRLPIEQSTHLAYSIQYKICQEEYVGETMRALNVCCKDYRDTILPGNTDKSAVAEHLYSHAEPHRFNWAKVKVLDHDKGNQERKIWEAFHITKKEPKMNRDQGIERSDLWNAII